MVKGVNESKQVDERMVEDDLERFDGAKDTSQMKNVVASLSDVVDFNFRVDEERKELTVVAANGVVDH